MVQDVEIFSDEKNPWKSECTVSTVGLLQDLGNSISNPLVLLQSCIKLTISWLQISQWHKIPGISGWGGGYLINFVICLMYSIFKKKLYFFRNTCTLEMMNFAVSMNCMKLFWFLSAFSGSQVEVSAGLVNPAAMEVRTHGESSTSCGRTATETGSWVSQSRKFSLQIFYLRKLCGTEDPNTSQ